MAQQYEVQLSVAAGPDGAIRPLVLAGQTVPILITALVQDQATVPSGIELRILRPDGITVTWDQKSLRQLTANSWRTLACMDLPGPYEITARCLRPSQARAMLTLRAQSAPGDPPPGTAATAFIQQSGQVWTTQDGRPWTLQA